MQTVRAAAGAGRGLRDAGHQLGAAQAGAGGLRGQVALVAVVPILCIEEDIRAGNEPLRSIHSALC